MLFSEPDLRHSMVMQEVASALVEAVGSLVGQGDVQPGAAPGLLDSAIQGLPAGARSMVRFEAHRLWMRRIDNLG
ncbi:hypothetical protein [Roseomonas sp. 18066]|uniref:hypothetical protein n=1 Tax=Roseomonas sp. 18066 TaxID=2681412 RepID=UPI00135B95DD|nr:hypothetical protein [Roseomonas sp. 18066]